MTGTMILDGAPFRFETGETIAMALSRHAAERGLATPPLFCGIGQCQACLVHVTGRGPVEACLAPCEDGLEIRRHDAIGTAGGND